MPVLPKEPSLWPEGLLSADFAINTEFETEEIFWWALHTRPRAEKTLARRLLGMDICFYLPLYEKRRRLQHRWVVSHLPLFPSYLFLRGPEDDRLAALRTNLVVNCLEIHEQERFVDDLSHVYELVESGLPVSPEEKLKSGSRAEIVCGPLTGFQGQIIRRGNSTKLVCEVHFLQRGASVEVDASMVRPL